MNVAADFASRNWKYLFSDIQEQCRRGRGDISVELPDDEAYMYDFDNESLMPRMRERLIETLQEATSMTLCGVTFGNKFFMTMDEEQQRSFFHRIFSLRFWRIGVGVTDRWATSTEITISTSALLDSLPHLHEHVLSLTLDNFAFIRQSDVEALSNIILSKSKNLYLELPSIQCPVNDCNKEDSDEPNGFLDPLFNAISGLDSFFAKTKKRDAHWTLVSPTALRALFVEGKQLGGLMLNDLGLTDSHVVAIVDGLSTPGTRLSYLNLESNPGITAQGYGALLNLSNRANVIGNVTLYNRYQPFVDEKAWEDKIRLVSEMNSKYGRLEYMTNGTFTSQERTLQWLEELADRIRREEFSDRGRDAKHLNFIWYTLCQHPEMIQT
jgi:hypothetical protein